MNKLGRLIRVKFICTDELLKKLLGDYHPEDHYKEMKDTILDGRYKKLELFDEEYLFKIIKQQSNKKIKMWQTIVTCESAKIKAT